VNTQVNRLTMTKLVGMVDVLADAGVRGWQIQATAAMGRAADEPDVLLQPYDLIELFPVLAEIVPAAKARGIDIAPGNNLGYFGPHETALRGRSVHGHSAGCGAGRLVLGLEADGTVKGCPSLTTTNWAGGNVRDAPLREI